MATVRSHHLRPFGAVFASRDPVLPTHHQHHLFGDDDDDDEVDVVLGRHHVLVHDRGPHPDPRPGRHPDLHLLDFSSSLYPILAEFSVLCSRLSYAYLLALG